MSVTHYGQTIKEKLKPKRPADAEYAISVTDLKPKQNEYFNESVVKEENVWGEVVYRDTPFKKTFCAKGTF